MNECDKLFQFLSAIKDDKKFKASYPLLKLWEHIASCHHIGEQGQKNLASQLIELKSQLEVTGGIEYIKKEECDEFI